MATEGLFISGWIEINTEADLPGYPADRLGRVAFFCGVIGTQDDRILSAQWARGRILNFSRLRGGFPFFRFSPDNTNLPGFDCCLDIMDHDGRYNGQIRSLDTRVVLGTIYCYLSKSPR